MISDLDLLAVFRANSRREKSGCLRWTGRADGAGYGIISVAGVNTRAHRLALELITGASLLPGTIVQHTCDHPWCVRVSHLRVGTHQTNQADKVAKNRQAKGERNGRAKLTAEQAAEIRRRRLAGEGPTALASEFGVSRRAVQFIQTGTNWAHLGGARR